VRHGARSRPLPDRDHEGGSEEDADLPELHLFPVTVVTCSPQDRELDVPLKPFELRAQVKRLGILDRQLVQTEARPDLGELLCSRLEEPQPDEPALAAACGRLFERDRTLVLATTISIMGAIDDHGMPPARYRR
jgi:hypothetical protein